MKPRTNAATHSINHGDTKGKQHSLEEKSQFGVYLWSYWIVFWVVMHASSPERAFGRLLTKQSVLTERAPTFKDLLMLQALIEGTLILLMLLSASSVTTSQDAKKKQKKTLNPPHFEHYLPVPLSP